MEQREEHVAFLLLPVPQPARAMGLGRSRMLSFSARNYRAGLHLSMRWTPYSFTCPLHSSQAVSLRVERWSGIHLLQIPARLIAHLRSLYISMMSGEVDGRLSVGGIIHFRYIIVSFGMRYACGTSLYRRYGQLRQYSTLLCSFMLVYVPSCHSYAALCHFLALQIVQLGQFEMICSHRWIAMYFIENAKGEENERP